MDKLAKELKTGDTVKLKSGGPPMTINSFFAYIDVVTCMWFVNDKVRKEGHFNINTLKKYKTKTPEK